MDTTRYSNWTPAVLVKGKYDLKVDFAEYFESNKVDDNGEKSTGMKFTYEVVGPGDAVMSNGACALGEKFGELLLHAKESSSPKYTEMCARKWSSMLKAVFGEHIPPRVEPEDFIDKVFTAQCTPKFSEFDQAEVPNISWRGVFGS